MSMIKPVLRSLSLVALLLGANLASAAEAWYQDNVKWVYPQANGGFIIAFVNSPASCLSTANPKYFHVTVGAFGVTSDGVKAMLASVLMAYAAGKKVNVAFEASSTYCDVNRLYISD
jgi:hypothetical protein